MPVLRSLGEGGFNVLCRNHPPAALALKGRKKIALGKRSETSAALGHDPHNTYFFMLRSPEKRRMKKPRIPQRWFLRSKFDVPRFIFNHLSPRERMRVNFSH
jgi:hypothetical protein